MNNSEELNRVVTSATDIVYQEQRALSDCESEEERELHLRRMLSVAGKLAALGYKVIWLPRTSCLWVYKPQEVQDETDGDHQSS